jgi:KipI family sensor histidine kinase inhibitor
MDNGTEQAKILPAGDSCLFVDFGSSIALDINGKVQDLRVKLEKRSFPGVREMVPTYRSLAIYFDPSELDLERFTEELEALLLHVKTPERSSVRKVTIPVCYGGTFGPDLENVASLNGITSEEVIRIHSTGEYYCYMLGFTPGFPYRGGMDKSIAAPRLESPREVIPAGSVGIAGTQTGVYPIESPGGWQLIGRTPLRLFDAERTPPILLEAGIWITFSPITETEFERISRQVSSGTWDMASIQGGDPE